MSTIALARWLGGQGVVSSAVCLEAGDAGERDELRDAMQGRVAFRALHVWNRKIRAARWKRPLIEWMQLARTRALVGSTRAVEAAARTRGATLVHSNTLLTLEGGIAARRLGLPHVWHARELVGRGAPFRFPVEGIAFRHTAARLADVFVANSSVTAARLRGWVPAERLRLVWNGIDVSDFADVRRPDPGRTPVVCMIGSTSSRVKKHSLFLRALARIRVPFEARIYGHHDSRDSYGADLEAEVTRLGLDGRVRFAGFHPPVEALGDATVLVHPANDESFGRVIVEAMAAGVPVVTVRGGGGEQIVQDGQTGTLVPADDAEALGAATEAILRSTDRGAALGLAGRRVAAERFSIEAHGHAMMKVYQSVQRR